MPSDDELKALLSIYKDTLDSNRKIEAALDQAKLDQATQNHIRNRLEWLEKIANSIYNLLCEVLRTQHSLLEILGSRLRKDSDELNLLQKEIGERALKNGLKDLLEVKAGGDVTIDQSRREHNGKTSKH